MTDSNRERWFSKLRDSLSLTRETVAAPLNRIVGRKGLDESAWEELEELLISSDLGVEASVEVVEAARREFRQSKATDSSELKEILGRDIAGIFKDVMPARPVLDKGERLTALVLVGVNGTGKTTTAGKIAYRVGRAGGKAIIAASDTFRAAAIEQITAWAEAGGADIVKHQRGGDSAAVAFDAAKAAKAREADFLIVDTAGRLHTKTPLLKELKKVKAAIRKEAPDADIKTLLVMDATTGQNGLNQAETFLNEIGVDGVVLTKLDGTAKGGIAAAIARRFSLPVVLVGTGEGPGDLVDFDADAFAEGLIT